MKVYTDAPVGTTLKLKVESTNSGAANEKDVLNTVSGAWATYTWDFAGDPPVYNVITFMYGYGVVGDASPTSTFYIDDILQTNANGTVGIAEFIKANDIKVYPNPAHDYFTISTESENIQSIFLYDLVGNIVLKADPNAKSFTISTTDLKKGIYVVMVKTKVGENRIKVLVD